MICVQNWPEERAWKRNGKSDDETFEHVLFSAAEILGIELL